MDTQQLMEFIGNHPYLTGGFVAVLLFWLYTEAKRKMQGFGELTPAQAAAYGPRVAEERRSFSLEDVV